MHACADAKKPPKGGWQVRVELPYGLVGAADWAGI